MGSGFPPLGDIIHPSYASMRGWIFEPMDPSRFADALMKCINVLQTSLIFFDALFDMKLLMCTRQKKIIFIFFFKSDKKINCIGKKSEESKAKCERRDLWIFIMKKILISGDYSYVFLDGIIVYWSPVISSPCWKAQISKSLSFFELQPIGFYCHAVDLTLYLFICD